jgi:6-phosphogluconate dehydrogenase
MKLGMVGLGRMGANLTRRLVAHGHEVAVYDLDQAAVAALQAEGAEGAADLARLAAALPTPRVVWVMVPAGVTGRVLNDVAAHLEPGDILIDGGNSNYQDDLARAAQLAPTGVHLVDVGTSGGVFGLERGYCLMVGGEPEVVSHLQPVFEALAPGLAAAERTPGRQGEPAPGEEGWLHCGPVGAGHFVKMVHNGVEYGLMAAYAEGLNVLRQAGIGRQGAAADAETAPLRHPEHYQFDLDVGAITELWRRGSVVSSWLLDLTAAALAQSPDLAEFTGNVSDSGEGRWTVLSAVEQGVPAPVLSAALYARFDSRGHGLFANQVLSAMRSQFGGHQEQGPREQGPREQGR